MSYAIRSALADLLRWLADRVDPEHGAADDWLRPGGTD